MVNKKNEAEILTSRKTSFRLFSFRSRKRTPRNKYSLLFYSRKINTLVEREIQKDIESTWFVCIDYCHFWLFLAKQLFILGIKIKQFWFLLSIDFPYSKVIYSLQCWQLLCILKSLIQILDNPNSQCCSTTYKSQHVLALSTPIYH